MMLKKRSIDAYVSIFQHHFRSRCAKYGFSVNEVNSYILFSNPGMPVTAPGLRYLHHQLNVLCLTDLQLGLEGRYFRFLTSQLF